MNAAHLIRHTLRTAVLCVVASATAIALVPVATASVPIDEAADDEARLRVLSTPLPVPEATGNTSRALWLWPDGRRGYQLAPADPSTSPGYADGLIADGGCVEPIPEKIPGTTLPVPSSIRCPASSADSQLSADATPAQALIAYDLDTNAEVGRTTLDRAVDLKNEASFGGGHTSLGAVDTENGRLFLPYVADPIASGYKNPAMPGRSAATLSRGDEVCTPGTTPAVCVGGILVIDGTTLQTVARIPLRSISLDGAPVRPLVRAVEYAPPRGENDNGKVYMLLEESAHAPLSGVNSPTAKGANLAYLAQMDPDTGQQDWVIRLEACRYMRDTHVEGSTRTDRRPNAAAILRAPSMENPAVWAACHTGPALGAVVRIALDENGQPGRLPVTPRVPAGDELISGGEPSADPAAMAGSMQSSAGQDVFPGPEGTAELMADPVSGRFLMRVIAGDPQAEVWWVFDTALRNYVGTIGIGPLNLNSRASTSGLDRVHGRLYVFVPPYSGVVGGMYLADIRRSPLPQALVRPEVARIADWDLSDAIVSADHNVQISVDPGDDSRPPRLYWRFGTHKRWTVIEDHVSMAEQVEDQGFGGRTLDLVEEEGVTASTWDGAARGYGARALFVGGLLAAGRAGPIDAGIYQGLGPRGRIIREDAEGVKHLTPVRDLIKDPCATADREIVLASVGGGNPAVVDVSGGRGSARPLSIDSTMAADLESPFSRCAPLDWEHVWETGLLGAPLLAEPSVPSQMLFGKNEATCLSSSESPEDRAGGGLLNSNSTGDPVGSPFAAAVKCSPDDVSGWSQARVTQVGDLSMTNAHSSFRLYRDADRGIVARIESVARGVAYPGAFRVDSVRAVAESWANGRNFDTPEVQEGETYDPNCDYDRGAGTCFQRHVFGVWTPGYTCGPCGDEGRLEAALTRAMGSNGMVRLRQPDPRLARGADNGFIAAIQKPDHERFADLVLNNDLLQSVVPGLEIIRFANPGNRLAGNTGGRGRQIYQFAGVEVSSSYSIQCLLVYDEETNICAEPAEAPGSIQVSLSDPDGQPLAGGAFELREDVDADGVLGLKDTLLPDGACVTAEDGIGTCTFENLQPGTYLVSQVAAPPGYAKSAEPWVSEVASGEQRVVAFTNVSNVSTIDMTVTDEDGAPLSGATFAAYPDPDADGKVAPEATPAAECTTDAQGVCSMQVPAGSYVLVQTGAPGGLEGIEPVAFTFASGGQVAAVTVVNYPPSQPAAPEGAASPEVIYTPPVDSAPPIESVNDDFFTPAEPVDTSVAPSVSLPEQIGGTVVQVIRAPGDALRLLARDPKQAVAWTAALMLFALAILAVRRRQQVSALIGR